MAKSENAKATVRAEQAIPVETILLLPEVKKYQQDFAKTLLSSKKEYTKTEALAILKDFFGE